MIDVFKKFMKRKVTYIYIYIYRERERTFVYPAHVEKI